MDRRRLLIAVASGGIALRSARGQTARRRYRIGYLIPAPRDASAQVLAMFGEAMRRRGLADGDALEIDFRAVADVGRLAAAAAGLVDEKVDLIVAASPPAILAASRATETIPIVMAFWGGEGLVESGLVASLARPGRNVTGVHILSDELDGKRLDVLLRAFPAARRIGVLGAHGRDELGREVVQVAGAARIELVLTKASLQGGYDNALAALRRDGAEALLVLSEPRFALEYERVIAAAAAQRIGAIYEWGYMARAGGLLAYGPELAQLYDRVADFAVRILRGARPSTLPVEQPTKFELVVNLKTARALGLAMPQALLIGADEVIL